MELRFKIIMKERPYRYDYSYWGILAFLREEKSWFGFGKSHEVWEWVTQLPKIFEIEKLIKEVESYTRKKYENYMEDQIKPISFSFSSSIDKDGNVVVNVDGLEEAMKGI